MMSFLFAIMIVVALVVALALALALVVAIIAVIIIAMIVIGCSEPAADFVVLSRQAARPPETDGLYEGLYEDFVQGNR